MEAPGTLEDALARAQPFHQRRQQGGIDGRAGGKLGEVAPEVLDQDRAAHAAGGAGEHRPFGPAARRHRELDVDLIRLDQGGIDRDSGRGLARLGADANVPDGVERTDDALGEHQAEGELDVFTWRAHDDSLVDADVHRLQWLYCDYRVGDIHLGIRHPDAVGYAGS